MGRGPLGGGRMVAKKGVAEQRLRYFTYWACDCEDDPLLLNTPGSEEEAAPAFDVPADTAGDVSVDG